MAKTVLLFQPVLQFFDDNGAVLNGGSLEFKAAGTSTDKDTYADSAQAVTNPNPITLDSAGRPDNSGSPIQIWLDGSYKLIVKDSSGNTIRTEDNLTSLAEATGVSAKSANYTVTAQDYGKLIYVDTTTGDITITLPAAATVGSGYQVMIGKSDSSTNDVIVDGNAAETINGTATQTIGIQYGINNFMSDGTNWVMTTRNDGVVGVNSNDSGETALSQTSPGVELTAATMNTTNKYSPAIKFGSTDPQFTTTNPKWSAGIAGYATETYGADTDSGMGIEFFTTADDAGATPTPSSRMTIDQDGNVSISNGTLAVTDEDARTDTVDDIVTLTSTTTGTPAANIGTGVLFKAESADENPSDFGRTSFIASTVTAGAEDTYFSIQTRAAGAALSDAYKMEVTGVGNYIFTGAPSAERTVTLPDYDLDNWVVQRVSTSSSTEVSTTTVIPYDDTIPQNTEGAEIITQAITPKASANILVIDVVIPMCSMNAAGTISAGLFQDSTAAALSAASISIDAVNASRQLVLRHIMSAGTTSSTTFKVRIGPDANVAYASRNAVGIHSTANPYSIMITEYTA